MKVEIEVRLEAFLAQESFWKALTGTKQLRPTSGRICLMSGLAEWNNHSR